MAGFCLLPAVFLRTAHCLGRTAAQSVRVRSAIRPALRNLPSFGFALHCREGIAPQWPNPFQPLQIGLVPPRGRLTGIPACFFDGDGRKQAAAACASVLSCRCRAAASLPYSIICTGAARRRFAPAELPKAEKTRIRRIICTMRRLVSGKAHGKTEKAGRRAWRGRRFCFYRAASARADCRRGFRLC